MAIENLYHVKASKVGINKKVNVLRDLWVKLRESGRSLCFNGLDPQESLILINRFLLAKGKPPIGLAVRFILDIGCNADCVMCSVRELPVSGKSYERVTRFLDFIDFPTVSEICLLNGEPLLDKKGLVRLIKKCRAKNLKVMLVTNAMFLTEEYIDQLVRSGLEKIEISIDSHERQKHDSIRRVKGIFDNAIRSIRYLKQNHPHVQVNINTVVMSINIQSIPHLVEMATELDVDVLNLIYMEDYGRNFEKLRLTDMDRKVLQEMRHEKAFAQSKVRIHWDSSNAEKKTGNVYGHYRLGIRESGEIIFEGDYSSDQKVFLDRPLAEIFTDKVFQKG